MARVNIYMSDDELRRIDEFCETQGFSRSKLFLKGVALFMGSEIRPLHKVVYNKVAPTPAVGKFIDKEVDKVLGKVQEEKAVKTCKHGRKIGLCEYRCTK